MHCLKRGSPLHFSAVLFPGYYSYTYYYCFIFDLSSHISGKAGSRFIWKSSSFPLVFHFFYINFELFLFWGGLVFFFLHLHFRSDCSSAIKEWKTQNCSLLTFKTFRPFQNKMSKCLQWVARKILTMNTF